MLVSLLDEMRHVTGKKLKEYILNKKVLTFFATVILINNSVVVGGNANPLDLTDSEGNDWFNIELSIQGGEAHFEWESEDPSTSVEIFGESIGTLTGQENGLIEAPIYSAESMLEFNVQAQKTIYETQQPGAEPEAPLIVQYITSLRVANPDSNMLRFGESPASASSSAAKTYLRYQTFIPKPYVDAPEFACTLNDSKKYLFAGDNRGFNPDSNAFKTRFQVTVDWLNKGNLAVSRTVGATRRYQNDGNDKPILSTLETKTASANGMVLTNFQNSSTLVHYKLDHSVMNPMCSALAADSIRYETDVWIARSGAYTITNRFRLAPNHELYLKDSDQPDWTTLMQESTYSMDCLAKLISEISLCNKSVAFHETSR